MGSKQGKQGSERLEDGLVELNGTRKTMGELRSRCCDGFKKWRGAGRCETRG